MSEYQRRRMEGGAMIWVSRRASRLLSAIRAALEVDDGRPHTSIETVDQFIHEAVQVKKQRDRLRKKVDRMRRQLETQKASSRTVHTIADYYPLNRSADL